MSFLALVLGKLTTIIASSSYAEGVLGVATNYWEKRYLIFVFVPCAILGSVSISYVAGFIRKHLQQKKVRALAISALMCMLLMGSVSSTFVGIETYASGKTKEHRLAATYSKLFSF